jgi:hypothetical protein
MMTLEEITVDERIRYLEQRVQQLEEWLTDVANDFIARFVVNGEDK